MKHEIIVEHNIEDFVQTLRLWLEVGWRVVPGTMHFVPTHFIVVVDRDR